MDSVEDIYSFDSDRKHQGLAVVIVNFTTGEYKRDGAKNDLKYMKKTFKRLGFKVECHTDVETPKMQRLLEKYSKREDLGKYSCFAFGISSHGIEIKGKEKKKKFVSHHAVQMFDGDYFYTKDIIEYFRDGKCNALKNKPKMFFVQACRIPEDKTSKDHYDGGVGFDKGMITPSHVHPLQGSSKDATDHRESEDEDSVEEDFVSDTDDEDELSVVAVNEDQNACRIPEDKTSKDHYDGGVGFDKGMITPLHVHPLQGSSRDATDHRKSEDKDSVEEDFVSDTDDEDELSLVAVNEDQNDIGEIEKNLEKRQVEILKNLRRLNSEAWVLKQGYSLVANQIKDQNSNASANQNKENDAQTAASQSEENDLQSAANQSQVQTSSMGRYDEVDPGGRRRYPPVPAKPVHYVSVPCHNDMLIMFASPQGYYAIRSKEDGSYMLRYLYEVVEKHYKNGGRKENQINFLDVLTDVSAIMAMGTYFGEKEYTIVPCVVHKLDRDIIFTTQGKKMLKHS